MTWRLGFLTQQLAVLGLAGIALLFTTLGSPIYQAVFARLPDVPLPVGSVPAAFLAPLLIPLIVGLPLALTRYRALTLLWFGVMTLLAVVAVIEVSRLNWVAFSSGVAFRVTGGPVPIVRTAGGLALVLLGLALLAHQSVHVALLHLFERGVTRRELGAVRAGLLGLERTVLLLAFGAGVVLVLVAAVSMGATEGAPKVGGEVTAWLIWTLLLAAALVGALYWGARRKAA